MPTRRRIHTSLKLLAHTNALPNEYRQQISASQLSKYKRLFNPEEYFGHELNSTAVAEIDTLRLLNENKELKRILLLQVKLFAALKYFFITKKETLKCLNNDQFLNYISAFEKHLSKTRMARFLKVSPQTISAALKRKAFACGQSVHGLCHKKYFQQLTPIEVTKIKSYCEDEKYQYWPLMSIYYQGLKDKVFQFRLATFYKYAKIMGLTRKSKRNHRPTKGLKSSKVNEYWNADITLYTTADNVKQYIYLVMDHFSKKILAFKVGDKVCSVIRTESFKDAVEAFLTQNSQDMTTLVVDGGPENCNANVDGYLESVKNILRKVVALKDIIPSNSPVEALNKVLKNNYLNKMNVANKEALTKILKEVVEDYNNRPHGSLLGFTPNEVYNDDKIDLPTNFREARDYRKNFNRNFCCINKT
jgi:putative transposase